MYTTSDHTGFTVTQYLELLLAFFLGVFTIAAFRGCPF